MRQQTIPLAHIEMLDWLSMLGRTQQERLEVVEDILRHSEDDDMSVEDLDTCYKALAHLRTSMGIMGVANG